MKIKEWNYVFESFWCYKRHKTDHHVKFRYATPINLVKLESAILYMIDNISREISISNDSMKNDIHPYIISDKFRGFFLWIVWLWKICSFEYSTWSVWLWKSGLFRWSTCCTTIRDDDLYTHLLKSKIENESKIGNEKW